MANRSWLGDMTVTEAAQAYANALSSKVDASMHYASEAAALRAEVERLTLALGEIQGHASDALRTHHRAYALIQIRHVLERLAGPTRPEHPAHG